MRSIGINGSLHVLLPLLQKPDEALLGLVAIRQRPVRAGGRARLCLGKPRIGSDQGTSARQIFGIDKAGQRDRDKVAICEVEFAIGIGESLRFDEQMPGARVAQPHFGEVETFKLAEHLQHGHASGGGRPHRADAIGAIAAADRLALLCLVTGDIGRGHRAGVRRIIGNGAGNLLRQCPGVESARPGFGDGLERLGERFVDNDRAHRARLA